MNKLTRNGICYNLKKSPYKYELENLTYYFSSQFYMDKFIYSFPENREKINNLLSKRYDIRIEMRNLADIYLYCSIEKRGFAISYGGKFICKEKILLGELLKKID